MWDYPNSSIHTGVRFPPLEERSLLKGSIHRYSQPAFMQSSVRIEAALISLRFHQLTQEALVRQKPLF